MNNTTYMAKNNEVESKWYIIDASQKPLGRVAAEAAKLLRGKHKPTFTPHIDCGDYIIIVNAEKVLLTGNKLNDKKYYNHSMYAGGLRERTAKEMIERYPEEMIERAVKGMLPKGRLGRQMYKKLFVYAFIVIRHVLSKCFACLLFEEAHEMARIREIEIIRHFTDSAVGE